MGTDIKLKDLFGQTQTEQDISTVSVPKADGTGREFYVKRPVIYYNLVASPPYASESTEDIPIFWNIGDGGLLDDVPIDTGNCLGVSYAPIAGKTTKSIVAIRVKKYFQGVTADNAGEVWLIYLYEELSGGILLEKINLSGTADFTAQPGWGQLIQGTDGQTYTYTQLTDLSGIAIGIEQPNNILNQRLLFSYLTEKTNSAVAYTAAKNGAHTIVPPAESSGISTVNLTVDVPEPNLQDKSVAITENGTQEFSADTGYDGIKKLTATVNVAGGGGTGVQPDYAQNNTTAADYIKNRPGGYTIENPAISKTIAASDYVSIMEDLVYKFSDVVLPNETILGGTGKIKTISNGVETETDISSITYMGTLLSVRQFSVKDSSGLECIIICGGLPEMGLEFATWLGAATDSETGAITAYISQFTTAADSTIVEIPEKFTAVKPANWGSGAGYGGYIVGRPGGYFLSYDDFAKFMAGLYTYTWDGVVGDKETITLQYGNTPATYVKVSTDTPCILAFAGGEIETVVNGQATTYNISRSLIDVGALGVVGIYIGIGNEDGSSKSAVPMAILSFGNPSIDTNSRYMTQIPQGIWFLYVEDTSGSIAYCSKLNVNSNIDPTFRAAMPYELVEQNPNTLTTNNQTFTDAQKLQVRTNIGLADDDINKLIDTKLGVIENGSY